MNARIRLLVVTLAVMLVGTFAVGQSTLGNMFRLGGSTTANLPASSTYTVGALIYDLDAGAPLYSDGTVWKPLADMYWTDAGAGYISPVNALLDGGYISTPSYIESTRTFAAGDGLIAARVRASGGADTSFTLANVATGAAGSLAYNSTTDQMMMENGLAGFTPLQAYPTFNKQVFSTRILGVSGSTGGPEIAEKVATTSGQSINAFWGSTGTGSAASVAITLGRTMYAIQPGTEANSRYFGTTQDTASLGNLKPIVSTSASPGWCQLVQTGAAITSLRIWAGLVSTGTSTGTSTMNGDGVMFRYDTNVDGLLYLCSRDGTTQSCDSTGLTVAINTVYHLCFNLDASRNIYASVNGRHVVNKTTNKPTAGVALAPWVEVQVLTGSTNSIAVGQMVTTSY